MAVAQFTDPFDTISPDWVLNRYDPHGFAAVSFLGDMALAAGLAVLALASYRRFGVKPKGSSFDV